MKVHLILVYIVFTHSFVQMIIQLLAEQIDVDGDRMSTLSVDMSLFYVAYCKDSWPCLLLKLQATRPKLAPGGAHYGPRFASMNDRIFTWRPCILCAGSS